MTLQVIKSKIGNAEITQVVEMELDQYYPMFLPQATPDKIREIKWLKAPYIKDDYTMTGSSQCFIINLNERIFVIDTCIGNEKEIKEFPFWDNLNTDFLETLDNINFDRNSVTDVICTHLHLDHVGWNTYKKDGKWHPTFPNAKYHFAKDEYEWWHTVPAENEFLKTHKTVLTESVYPIVEAGLADFVDSNADLGDGISLISTPGHTIAHVAVQIKSGDETFIIGGDMCHHPCQIAKPEWAMASDYSQEKSIQTRREMFENLSNSQTLFACTHFKNPSFGLITKDDDGNFVFTGIEK